MSIIKRIYNFIHRDLLEMIENNKVILDPIVDFQEKKKGKYKLKNGKAYITDDNFDEIPYGTLSSLIKNKP